MFTDVHRDVKLFDLNTEAALLLDRSDHAVSLPQLGHSPDWARPGRPPALPRDQREQGAALPARPPHGPAAPGGLPDGGHVLPPTSPHRDHQTGTVL